MSQVLKPDLTETAKYLAVTGQYEAALALLRESGHTESELPTEALLVKAKILAQQGDYQRAVACWRLVLTREPGHPEAAAAVRRVQQVVRPIIGPLFRYSHFFHGSSLLVLLAVGSVLYFAARAGARPVQVAAAPPRESSIDLERRLQQLQDRVQQLEMKVARSETDSTKNGPVATLPAEPSPQPAELASQPPSTDNSLANQISQIQAQVDALATKRWATAAETEDHFAALNFVVEMLKLEIQDMTENQQSQLRELKTKLRETTAASNRWREQEMMAQVRQWMFLDVAYRQLNTSSLYRQQLHDSLQQLLDQFEKMTGSEWKGFIRDSRRFLDHSRGNSR